MASPVSNNANEATENFLDSTVISSSHSSRKSNDDDCHSAPSSPEIGMAREGGSDVRDLDLEADEEDVAGTELLEMPSNPVEQYSDDVVSATENEDQVARIPRIRQTQQSPPESTQSASPEPTNAQSITPALTCPPTHRSARAKSTLIYDQKYHPMDDIIRPSQAAKRRSLHGERLTLGDGSDDEVSEDSGSDMKSMIGVEDSDDEESPRPTRGRKRKRFRSRTPEPTRRSSRRRTKPKVSYNMKIHPQDSDLKRIWACDGSKSSPSPTKQVSSSRADSPGKTGSLEDFEAPQSLLADKSGESKPEPSSKSLQEPLTQQTPAPDPATKQAAKFVDTYPDLRPDVAYLTGNQDIWPDVKGLPFCIFTERIEDQLSAEAEAASPLHYGDDDKENDMVNPELVPTPNPLDGISIMPASYYRRSPRPHVLPAHGSVASNAFYVHPQFEALPYGLGWSDGAHDMNNSDTHNCPVPDYVRILASSENLPRASTPTEICSHRNEPVISFSPARNLERFELRR